MPVELELVWAKFSPPRHPRGAATIIVCVVYITPRNTAHQDLLIEHLSTTGDLLRARFPSSKLLICGDFNRTDTTPVQSDLHLKQVVDFPTYQDTTLDLILTDMDRLYKKPVPRPHLGMTTHSTVLWEPLPTLALPNLTHTRVCRPLRDSSIREFGRWITSQNWSEMSPSDDVETLWTTYHTMITEAYHRCFPEETSTHHLRDLPWMSPRIKRLMKLRDNAFATRENARYRRLRNQVIREIKMAKLNYYPTKIEQLKQVDSSKYFHKIKNMAGLQKNSNTLPFITLPPHLLDNLSMPLHLYI